MIIPEAHRREFSVFLFLLFIAAFAIAWLRMATVKETYRYVQQEKELGHLEQEIQAARLAWLRLTSPKHLESLSESLRLYAPSPGQIKRYHPPQVTP